MLSFLLKRVLSRSLIIPVIWTSASLSLGGDIIVRDLRLEAEQLRIKIDDSRFNPKWTTVFDERVRIEEAQFRNGALAVSLDNPLSILRCLELADCIPRDALDETMAGLFPARRVSGRARLSKKTAAEKATQRKPLLLDVDKMSLKDSVVLLVRGRQGIALDVVTLTSEDLAIPLNGSDVSFRADVYLRDILPVELSGKVWNEDQAAPDSDDAIRYPVRMEVDWRAGEKRLDVRLLLREIPLELLSQVFPAQFASSGTISGQVILAYDATEKRWSSSDKTLPKVLKMLK